MLIRSAISHSLWSNDEFLKMISKMLFCFFNEIWIGLWVCNFPSVWVFIFICHHTKFKLLFTGLLVKSARYFLTPLHHPLNGQVSIFLQGGLEFCWHTNCTMSNYKVFFCFVPISWEIMWKKKKVSKKLWKLSCHNGASAVLNFQHAILSFYALFYALGFF